MAKSERPAVRHSPEAAGRQRSSVRAGQVRVALGMLGLLCAWLVPIAAPFAIEFVVYAVLTVILQWIIARRLFVGAWRALLMGFADTLFTSLVVQRFGSGTTVLPLIYVMVPALYATTTPRRRVSIILACSGTGIYACMVLLEQLGMLPYAPLLSNAVRPLPSVAVACVVLVTVCTFVTAALTSQLIAALATANARLSDLSQHDELTGLYNRRYVMQRLESELLRARRVPSAVTVAMVDLDGFKRVNDEIGHEAGDAVLQAVAEALLAATRKTDVVARYGGDEFVIVLPSTDPEGARTVSQRMLEGSREAAHRVCPSIPVSASIGTTAFEADDTPAEIIRRVDVQLYAAKRAGGDRITIG
jgi:diguanylate cyclase (GGDEF)-like protein